LASGGEVVVLVLAPASGDGIVALALVKSGCFEIVFLTADCRMTWIRAFAVFQLSGNPRSVD
jgi:hypothetical protein